MLRIIQCGHVRETSSSSSSVVSGLLNKNPISIAVVKAEWPWAHLQFILKKHTVDEPERGKVKNYIEATACYERSQYRLNGTSEHGPFCPFWSFMAERPEITQ